jgi:D-alanine-D-alanine ligase
MNVTILFGGKSSEHEVSLVSAASVARNLDSKKHNITLIGIAKDGTWYLQSEDELSRIKKESTSALKIAEDKNQVVCVIPGGGTCNGLKTVSGKAIPTDIVFPVLHGMYGEDGTIQGLFEMAEIPYCGCSVISSSVSMDKEKTKIIWEKYGLPVVPYLTLKKYKYISDEDKNNTIQKIEKTFKYPVFIKPACEGSSVGASKAENTDELKSALNDAFIWDEKVLVEDCINAREIECAVTGNNEITVYTPGEIVPTHTFYDYDAKYTDPNGAKLEIPALITEEQKAKITDIAKKAFKKLDGTGFSRIDFFIDKDSGKIYLNEINTIPGFTSISMFPKMCEASGLRYAQLIEKILSLGLERFNERRQLKTSLKN